MFIQLIRTCVYRSLKTVNESFKFNQQTVGLLLWCVKVCHRGTTWKKEDKEKKIILFSEKQNSFVKDNISFEMS